MDPLSDVLQLLAARSYVTSGQSAGGQWSMRYPGFDGMKFLALRKGHLWFRLVSGENWYNLSPGDGVILTRSASFILATDKTLTPSASTDVPYQTRDGIADYGGDDSVLLAGKMEIDPVTAGQLLDVLPTAIHFKSGSDASSAMNWLMNRLHQENRSLRPGASLASNHLMALMMIEGIRNWILSDDVELSGWMGALKDGRLMSALTAIHAEPERSWTLPELASIAGMSRSSFSRHFPAITGLSPLSYLAQWRMRIASKALRQSDEPVKHIAFRLGYGSESAFSTVFKRLYGVSPSMHRADYHGSPLRPLPHIP